MAKTNFTKVESFLDEGMRQIALNKLLDEADKAQGKPAKKKTALTEEQKELLRYIDTNLNRLKEVDPKIFTKLKVKKTSVYKLLKNSESLQEIDWKHLKGLKKKIDAFLNEYFPKKSNEEQIENEQLRHTKKRFNVNEKWLPLK